MVKKLICLWAFLVLLLVINTAKAENIDALDEGTGGSSMPAGDGIFSQVFGDNFNVTGGTLNYLPAKNAVMVLDYALLTIQGRTIQARNIVYFTDTKKLYAEGDVSVNDPKGTYLNCDQLYFDLNSWKGRARKVRMRNEDNTVNTVDSLEENNINFSSNKSIGNSGLSFTDTTRGANQEMDVGKMRMNLTASDMRMVSKDHYEATNVVASPSNYANPHWSIASTSVNIRNGEKVEAFNNVIKIGKIPIFYFPYLIYDLQYDWPLYTTSFGHDNKQGYYWLNRLGWKFKNPEFDKDGNKIVRFAQLDNVFANVDFRSNRGYGLGAELGYSVKGIGLGGSGNFRGYWTKEIYISDGDDIIRRNEDIKYNRNDWSKYNYNNDTGLYGHKNRYLIEWWHTQHLTEELDVRAQANYYSDPDFLKEYFLNEWRLFEEKKTNATLRYIGDHFVTEMIVQGRINDFQTQTDYMPEWRASLPGFKLFDLPVYLQSDIRAGLLRHRFDKVLSDLSENKAGREDLLNQEYRMHSDGETPWIGRVYNKTELTAPFDLGIINVRPHVGGFLAGYSKGYDGNYESTDGGKFNAALTWGVDFSSRFYGYLGSLRHLVEPTVSLVGLEEPVTDRSELYFLDDVDNYRKSHSLDFSLYQQLDTKNANGSTRRLARLKLTGGFILGENEAREYNNNEVLKELVLDGAIYPIESLSLFGDASYSFESERVHTASIGMSYWFSKQLRAYLVHGYNSGYTPAQKGVFGMYKAVDASVSNITTLALRTQLWNKHSRYSFEYAMSYQWDDQKAYFNDITKTSNGEISSGLYSQRFALVRDLDTMELTVGAVINYLDSNQSTIYFNLTPKGWLGIQRAPNGASSTTALDDNYGRYAHPVPEKMLKEDAGYNTDTPAWD